MLISLFGSLRHDLQRATTHHVCLYLGGNLLVLRIQVLHCLVLRLFRPLFDSFDLFCVFGVALRDRFYLSNFLAVNAIHSCDNILHRHVLIDGFTVGKGLLTLHSQVHLLLRSLLEEVDFLGHLGTYIFIHIIWPINI